MLNNIYIIGFLCLFFSVSRCDAQAAWAEEKSSNWYQKQQWLVGANFTPSTAVNQLEMWQAETFDTVTIDRELGWAENIGMNTMRVYLHHVAWKQDPKGFKSRVNQYLRIADKHGIKTVFVFFDDCWQDSYQAGIQPSPLRGTHNSRWLKDPGGLIDSEPKLMDTLAVYVKDVMAAFKNDKRILMWDLYNEPGHFKHLEKSIPLLQNVFQWARSVNPKQPLTSAVFTDRPEFALINKIQLENSDVITYHNYLPAAEHQKAIDTLKKYGKPMICTEYMARKRGSTFQEILPMLKRQHIGAINWGLVDGKTQTKYAWDEVIADGKDPALWYHDVFHKDGTPYQPAETQLIRSLTANKP